MEYKGQKRLTDLPLDEEIIGELAMEAEIRGMRIGELVGALILEIVKKDLFQLVRDDSDPHLQSPEAEIRTPLKSESVAQSPSRAADTGRSAVPRLRLRGARTAIERLHPHPLHQRLHVTTSDLAPLGHQQPSQHPRAGEGELQMKSVETPHDREVTFRHRPWQVVHTATANVPGRSPGSAGEAVRV